LFSDLPHYNAKEATMYIKQVLGDAYNYDSKPILETIRDVSRLGVVEKKEKGVYKYISKYPYYDGVGRF